MAVRKKLAIIDGKSVFYRGYYAMSNLSTKDGTPTGGVYGFAAMALELIRKLKPDYVCVAWDKPKTNIRKRVALYPQYKAGRKSPPADFYEQIPVLHELLDAFGWPLYELDDYEADDIMGALATQAKKKDIETMLISSDLDMLQLVNSHTHMYALKKGFSSIELFHPDSFEAKFGLKPEQFLDLKALKGDSSDNIPGVPGIGEKTAIELLKLYKTLDGVYDNLALIKDSVRKKLEAGKDLAELSKKLGAIWIDAPVKLDLKAVDGSNCDPDQLHDVLQKLEFRSLVRQLPEIMQVKPKETDDALKSFAHGKAGGVVVVDSDAKLDNLQLTKDAELVVHSRSAGKHGQGPKLLVLSTDAKTTYVVMLDKLSDSGCKKVAQFVAQHPLVGHDVKSTLQVLMTLGVKSQNVEHDVFVGAFLIDSLRREQTLTELANTDLGYEGADLDDLSDDELQQRAAEVTNIIRSLHAQQQEQLAKLPKIAKLAKDIEWPVISVLAGMEYEGIRLDGGYLEIMSEQLTDQISDIEQQIYGHADQEFNISSPAQLAEILYEKLKLSTTSVKKGKTGYSTAAKELDKLRGSHPIIDLITQYREYTKLKSTYVDTLPKMVDANSRVHTTFNLTISQTGRLSSTDPNLQNIPVRTELGKQIRHAFVASPGKVLVSADYNQFELRLAAFLADDKDMIEMFNNGADIHTTTAAEIYDRKPEEVTKSMRRDAKVINFGVLYGMSPHGLSVATGMTMAAAKTFIDKYFDLRKPLLEYMNKLREQARKDGYVETLFGRRRPTPDVHSSNFVVRQAAERAALNMPIQGTEADLMKMAMVAVQQRLEQQSTVHSRQSTVKGQETSDKILATSSGCKLLLQIHDSLILECPEDQAEKIAAMLKEVMEGIYKLPVRLDVDTTIGKNWGEL